MSKVSSVLTRGLEDPTWVWRRSSFEFAKIAVERSRSLRCSWRTMLPIMQSLPSLNGSRPRPGTNSSPTGVFSGVQSSRCANPAPRPGPSVLYDLSLSYRHRHRRYLHPPGGSVQGLHVLLRQKIREQGASGKPSFAACRLTPPAAGGLDAGPVFPGRRSPRVAWVLPVNHGLNTSSPFIHRTTGGFPALKISFRAWARVEGAGPLEL